MMMIFLFLSFEQIFFTTTIIIIMMMIIDFVHRFDSIVFPKTKTQTNKSNVPNGSFEIERIFPISNVGFEFERISYFRTNVYRIRMKKMTSFFFCIQTMIIFIQIDLTYHSFIINMFIIFIDIMMMMIMKPFEPNR